MKKLFSMIIITVMLLSALAMNAGAADEFAPEDAVNLFEDAEVLYLALENVKTVDSEFVLDKAAYKDNYDESKLGSNENAAMYRHYKVVSYKYGESDVKVETRAELEALIGKYFAEDVAKEYIKSFNGYFSEFPYSSATVNPLYVDENGMLYHLCDDITHQITERYYVVGYSDFVCGENEATITLTLRRTRVPQDDEYLSIPIKYEKTASGWRMSEDVFNTVLHYTTGTYEGEYRKYLISNPNTGDETAILIAILALSGLAFVCMPSVKRRER